jgi:hypothetical protein
MAVDLFCRRGGTARTRRGGGGPESRACASLCCLCRCCRHPPAMPLARKLTSLAGLGGWAGETVVLVPLMAGGRNVPSPAPSATGRRRRWQGCGDWNQGVGAQAPCDKAGGARTWDWPGQANCVAGVFQGRRRRTMTAHVAPPWPPGMCCRPGLKHGPGAAQDWGARKLFGDAAAVAAAADAARRALLQTFCAAHAGGGYRPSEMHLPPVYAWVGSRAVAAAAAAAAAAMPSNTVAMLANTTQPGLVTSAQCVCVCLLLLGRGPCFCWVVRLCHRTVYCGGRLGTS